MSLDRKSLQDREYNKFVESPSRPGEPAIEIVGNLTSTPGPFSPPATCDYVGRIVASNVETFEYRDGGASGTLLKTVTVTYTDATLEELVSVEVS